MGWNFFEAHLSTRAGAHLNATCKDHVTGLKTFVTPDCFTEIIKEVKNEVKRVADLIITELHNLFPTSYIIDALSIVYPQFWVGPDVDTSKLQVHLQYIKHTFCQYRQVVVRKDELLEKPIVSSQVFDDESDLFCIAIESNSEQYYVPSTYM